MICNEKALWDTLAHFWGVKVMIFLGHFGAFLGCVGLRYRKKFGTLWRKPKAPICPKVFYRMK